jgi:hypothetical protein
MGGSEVSTTVGKWSKGLCNKLSIIIRIYTYIHHKRFADYVAAFYHIFSYLFFYFISFFYMVVYSECFWLIFKVYILIVPGSSVGIATEVRAGRSGDRIPVGRDFPPVQKGPGAHPASCTMGTGSFPEVKYGRGVLLTTHPLLMPPSWKSRAISLPTLWATTGPVTWTLYLLF